MKRILLAVLLVFGTLLAASPRAWSVHEETDIPKLAAEGDARSQFRLAMEYKTGKGEVVRDYAKSWYWFHKALKSGLPGDLEPMAHQSLQELETTAPPAEIEKGRKMLAEDEKKAK
jgi:TPR repeat protein